MPEKMPRADDIWLVHLPARRPTSKQYKIHSSERNGRSAIDTARRFARPPFRARLFKQEPNGPFDDLMWELIEEWGDWDE